MQAQDNNPFCAQEVQTEQQVTESKWGQNNKAAEHIMEVS